MYKGGIMTSIRNMNLIMWFVVTASACFIGCGDFESADDVQKTTFVIHADESMALVSSETTSQAEDELLTDKRDASHQRNDAEENAPSPRDPQDDPETARLTCHATASDDDGGSPTISSRSAYCWMRCDCGSFSLRIRYTCGEQVAECWKYCDKFPGLK
jgi:hypothetical protein